VVTACVLAAATLPACAHAALLHDGSGCLVPPVVDGSDMSLELAPGPGRYLSVSWEPNVYVDSDPRPFAVHPSTDQAPGCPEPSPAGDDPTGVTAPTWQGPMYRPTTGLRELRISDARPLDVVWDHPGILDGVAGTRLVVARSSVELSTSSASRTSTAGRDPTHGLRLRALDATSLDFTDDGIADLVFADPSGSSISLVGSGLGDRVDLALLDPRVCVTARLLAGDDSWTAPRSARSTADTCDPTVDLAAGDDSYVGGAGDDHVIVAAGSKQIDLGAGNDILETDWHADESRRWSIAPGVGSSSIDAGPGDDQLEAFYGDHRIVGGPGSDTITAGNGRDRISGGGGDDSIDSGGGSDVVHGGDGNDHLSDEQWQSLARRYRGNDLLDGGRGNDDIGASFGTNRLVGGTGNDQLSARGSGLPYLFGGPGNDYITTYHNRSIVLGGAGRDYIVGSRMLGGSIDAGSGVDVVWTNGTGGSLHHTRLSCGAGIDWLYSAPVRPATCERQYYCFALAPVRECGRLPWPRRVSIDDLQPPGV
jgi:hypothetical protein